MKSYVIKGFFGAIVVWFLFLGVLSIFPIQSPNHVGEEGYQSNQENSAELLKRIDVALLQIQELKKNNAEMKRILGDAHPNALKALAESNEGKEEGDGDKIRESVPQAGDPTYAYEKMRRQLELDMKELWYTVRGHASSIGHTDFEQIQDIYRLLRSYLLKLRQEDGYETYRERETQELSKIMQNRIRTLQNPPDCEKAKKVVCSINKGCGFGCQIHHVVYCMVVAYATSRTLILESKGWRYNRQGWEKVFLPVSDTCTNPSGSSRADWGSGNHDVQVLTLPIVDFMKPRPPFLPITIPSDIAGRLEKVHGDPHIWWVGQFVTYLLRMQPQTQVLLDEAKSKMDISSPTVGVHVRRTDKVGTEASFHPLKEYMVHVEEYFAIREKYEGPVQRRVFIASDDPNVISEASRTYTSSEWQIMGDRTVAQSASVAQRYNGLIGIIKDVFLLAECDYVVCTFSSQVCRLAYEIMQTKHADASGRFVSLDDIYYYGGGSGTIQKAQFVHKPRSSGELELEVGDKIGVAGNHWNGMSKGTNQRTNKVGLYPSYKARNVFAKVNFPRDKWWTLSGEV
ncbi:Alpha-(1,6)-fucosyltransferase [Orchesella cincta]|uniref:Alpha-(1,6)-fucosyltransferase n=1 Tax=Orchesella cincta TaxID=48709 RepID=A0A1D2MIA6_ORCCI|nr:Alpha-(1,6)-fucosyltransferase [Orchesella cincta]